SQLEHARMVRSTPLHDLNHSHHSRNRRSRTVLHIRNIGLRPMRRRQWREERSAFSEKHFRDILRTSHGELCYVYVMY
ncbi:hypothetical protein ALC53_04246, partial [Atta colombica]